MREQDFFLLSSITLRELEEIKVSGTKSEATRYGARRAVRYLDENPDKYKVIVWDVNTYCEFFEYGLVDSPDNRIARCAEYAKNVMGYSGLVFCSNDLLARLIAKEYFRLPVEGVSGNPDEYTGFKAVRLDDSELAYLYEHLSENAYGLLTNQYLVVENRLGDVIDKFRWDGNMHCNVKFPNIKTEYFGAVKPYNGDIYQQMALNSFSQNQVTMIKGKAGTGKSYLALGYLFYLLEKHKIDRIIVFCNTVATANSAKLGYYPGSRDEKLLDSQIGNMLGSKLGGSFGLERLLQENKLCLIPMSDARGYDTGPNSGIYVTESQNMDISLMKLALQRIGEGSVCIIDGDYTTQVDLSSYAGDNNGMRRMSEVFRGRDFYGEVELQNIYRSEIAKVAELM